MIGISGETKQTHKWIIWSNQTSTQNLYKKMMTSDLETCDWNNMITSLSLEWWFYIRWLPESDDHQTNIQIKFHHIIKNASNSYSKFWYLCWTIKQHQSMEHSMCSWLAPSQTTSNHQSFKAGWESNRAKHGVTYYSSLDWLRKPVLLAVVDGLKQVNPQTAPHPYTLLSEMFFNKNQNVIQQESEMLSNEDQTVRSLEKSSHSGKNVCCVVPGTSSLIVHDFFSIHLVRHTGSLQNIILSAWSSTSISCAEHKASYKAETNLVSWGRPHLHQSLPFTIR